MKPAAYLFWLCAGLVMYAWAGYPLLLWAATHPGPRRRGVDRQCPDPPPSVSIIVAVHNEEAAVAGKIANCLALRYPPQRLEVLLASDGSTDDTVAIAERLAARDRRVRVYAAACRVGKTAVQNEAIRAATGEILLFTDVDALLHPEFLERLAAAFEDPRVGCATGALIWTNPQVSGLAEGGGLYWRFEHRLWRWETRLGVLAWGSGACLAVRRALFRPMEPQYGEDCIVPLDVVSLGYQVVFQWNALAYEARIADPRAEVRARVRMTLRSFAGTMSRARLLNPLRFPGVAWAIVSHKLLRWLTPYLLVLALASNLLLLREAGYRGLFVLQALFYGSAIVGGALEAGGLRVPLLSTIYTFSLMNLGVGVGVTKALRGERIIGYRSEG